MPQLQLSCLCLVCSQCVEISHSRRRKSCLTKRNAPELQTMQCSLISEYCRCGQAAEARGWCAVLQPPLQPDTAWCRCGHVNLSQTSQTDVMRPVSCRHLHDFMQTEHYTGINYCYKNNQARRIICNWGPSSSIRHQVYIPNQCRHDKCNSAPDKHSHDHLHPWCLTIKCLSPISLWSRVRQTDPAKSAQPWPA